MYDTDILKQCVRIKTGATCITYQYSLSLFYCFIKTSLYIDDFLAYYSETCLQCTPVKSEILSVLNIFQSLNCF